MNKFVIMTLGMTCLVTTGCSSVKEKLGLDRHTPDEFAVMQRAPLEIPTDLNSLPAPRPGAPRPQDVAAKDQAKQVILGEKAAQAAAVTPTASPSAVEDVLLKQAGAANAPADIRQKVTVDSKEKKDDARPVFKRMLGIGEATSSKVVDAEAEAKRIQDAKKAGKPITEGETPVRED